MDWKCLKTREKLAVLAEPHFYLGASDLSGSFQGLSFSDYDSMKCAETLLTNEYSKLIWDKSHYPFLMKVYDYFIPTCYP